MDNLILESKSMSGRVVGTIRHKPRSEAAFIVRSGCASVLLLGEPISQNYGAGLVPALLAYPQSVMVFDPGAMYWSKTAECRSTFSRVMKLDPMSGDTLRFNILDALTSGRDAWRDANLIATILTNDEGGSRSFWTIQSQRLLAATILYVKYSHYPDKSLAGVLSFLTDKVSLTAMLNAPIEDDLIRDRIHAIAVNFLLYSQPEIDMTRGVAVKALSVFRDPVIANASRSSDSADSNVFPLSRSLLPSSLYFCVEPTDIKLLDPFIRLAIEFFCTPFSPRPVLLAAFKLLTDPGHTSVMHLLRN